MPGQISGDLAADFWIDFAPVPFEKSKRLFEFGTGVFRMLGNKIGELMPLGP